jgi:hypothetical protein
MIAIDDLYNGYRALLLPITEMDEMVMNVVLSASAFHLSSRSTSLLRLGQKYRMATIQSLLCRGDLERNDFTTNHFNILAIMVLLVIEMINGGSDFPVLFSVLKHGLKAMGTELKRGNTPLETFLFHQTRK